MGKYITAWVLKESVKQQNVLCQLTLWHHSACLHTRMSPHEQLLLQNSIKEARTPQPGEIVFNTMRYRSSETVHRLGYFQSSVSAQKCLSRENNIKEKETASTDKVLKQDNSVNQNL